MCIYGFQPSSSHLSHQMTYYQLGYSWTSISRWTPLCLPGNSLRGDGLKMFFPVLPTPGACSNTRQLSQWCHPTISSSVVPFSSCLQSFPASGSFPMSQFFASGSQSIGASASVSVISVNIQGRFPLGFTGWISLKSKGFSRVFSNTTIQFFSTQLSLWSNFHIHTWLLEKP